MARQRELRRGAICWHRFQRPDKRRPVLVLGAESLLEAASRVPVVPFSTQVRGLPWEVTLAPEEGLRVHSVLKPEWVSCVPVAELGPWICDFPAGRWSEVGAAMFAALGLALPNR